MGQLIRRWPLLGLGVLSAAFMWSCDDISTLASDPNAVDPGAGGDDGGAKSDDDDAAQGDDAQGDDDDASVPDCDYTNDKTICDCLAYNCGALSVTDKAGVNRPIFCGTCSPTQYCQSKVDGAGIGVCGGTNLFQYAFEKEKVDMLVATAENDTTDLSYGKAENIGDGRGYSIGKVGFCTGTGDFIFVAACYNDLKPGNILAKYWGTRDAGNKAKDGLIYYNDAFISSSKNQGDTSKIDSLGPFVKDVLAAGAETDGIFRKCQDAVADALYLGTAHAHAVQRGLSSPLTVGFLYDTELNFGEDDDTGSGGKPIPGAKSLVAKADADYGASMPASFKDKPWEESKWLGYLIKERAIVMSGDATWVGDMDRNATWEAARRLHTAKTNSPETGTVLDMDYAIETRYNTGSSDNGTPCWTTGLAATDNNKLSVFTITTDKSASATDKTKWVAKGAPGPGYAACPANPTP